MATRVVRFLPAVVCMILFWLVSDRPGDLPIPSGGLDKVAHALAYAVLAGTLRWGFGPQGGRSATLASWAIAAAYGAVDEAHQSWVPGRLATVGDWIADMVGAAVGATLASRWIGGRRTRR